MAMYKKAAEKMANESNAMPMKDSKLKTKSNGEFISFSDPSVTSAPCASKIQEYLNHPVKNVKDLLGWWVDN